MKHITVGAGNEWETKWGKVGIHAIVEHFLHHKCTIDWIMQPMSLLYFGKPANMRWKLDRLKRGLEGTRSYIFEYSTLECHGTIAPFHPVKWYTANQAWASQVKTE